MQDCSCHNSTQLALFKREAMLKEAEFKREKGQLAQKLEQAGSQAQASEQTIAHLRAMNESLLKAIQNDQAPGQGHLL
jgi:hypothetical protein